MIDTVKIYCQIDKFIFDKVELATEIVKQGINKSTNQIFYEIVNDHLCGSYDTRFSVRVCTGDKYGFAGYCIEIEGSPHKIIRGQNAFNGFYNLSKICDFLIGLAEYSYDVILPDLQFWHLQRVDIAKCFDLGENKNVVEYVDNFRFLHFPRRQPDNYGISGVEFCGTTTTLKIYNKWLDFIEHDKKRFKDFNIKCLNDKNYNLLFDIDDYYNKIKGFVRFEVEVKSKYIKKLVDKYDMNDNFVINFDYGMLEGVFDLEFSKIFKFVKSDFSKVCEKNEVRNRLREIYKPRLAGLLYNMYMQLITDGFETTKDFYVKSSFYRNLKYLSEAGVDYTQSDISFIYKSNIINLDIFIAKEVA